jgi:hypothetical protein
LRSSGRSSSGGFGGLGGLNGFLNGFQFLHRLIDGIHGGLAMAVKIIRGAA